MMTIVLLVLGWYMVAAGVLLCVNPAPIVRLVRGWMKGGLSRGLAISPLAIGVLTLWAAPASRVPLFIQLLGVMGLAKGIYYFAAPKAQLTRVMNWWLGRSRSSYILWGITSLVLGAAVLRSL